jgi:hypothetical protein
VLTSFSYVFTFFGLVILPFYLSRNGKFFFRNTISLALKIQLLLVGIVFFSLFAFGWGSGIFVRNQYNKFTNNIINEKLVSLEIELRNKIGNFLGADVLITGTIKNEREDLIINARAINISEGSIISATQVILPKYLIRESDLKILNN